MSLFLGVHMIITEVQQKFISNCLSKWKRRHAYSKLSLLPVGSSDHGGPASLFSLFRGSVGVTSHLFLRLTGCPAETAPVSLFYYYSQALTRTNINLTAHKVLVTQQAFEEWCYAKGKAGSLRLARPSLNCTGKTCKSSFGIWIIIRIILIFHLLFAIN